VESILVELAEKTVLGAGFFYLLYYLVKNMEAITTNLTLFAGSLKEVSETLLKIDMRMEQIEARITRLEEKERMVV